MLKSARFKILFLVSVFTTHPSDWIDVFSSPLPRIKGFPKRDKTIKQAISDLFSDGLLEYRNRNDNVLIRPTPKGYDLLASYYHYYRSYGTAWDRKIRLLTYDIAEKDRPERDAIRRVLKLSGCGMWQNSFWISIYPIEDILNRLKDSGLRQRLLSYEVKFLSGDLKLLAGSSWNLIELNKHYQDINQKLNEVIRKPRSKRTMVDIFRENFLRYQRELELDPGLPSELLPKDWYGVEVRRAFIKVQKML